MISRPLEAVNLEVNINYFNSKKCQLISISFGFAESVFVPNQSVSLSELESDDRDIEAFKRFNYYFEPPKNKPKVNFNVKDIVVTKKQPSSDSSSPHLGEVASSTSNTPPQTEEEPKANACDPLRPEPVPAAQQSQPLPAEQQPQQEPVPQEPRSPSASQSDNFLNGIIGDEINSDRD